MQFNIHKCKVMHVGDSDSGLKRMSEYSVRNQKLKYCDTEGDLGVVMSADLKVESRCNQACLKANKLLGLIKRAFVVKTPEVMLNLYETLVCHMWTTAYLLGLHIIKRIKSFLKKCSTDSLE